MTSLIHFRFNFPYILPFINSILKICYKLNINYAASYLPHFLHTYILAMSWTAPSSSFFFTNNISLFWSYLRSIDDCLIIVICRVAMHYASPLIHSSFVHLTIYLSVYSAVWLSASISFGVSICEKGPDSNVQLFCAHVCYVKLQVKAKTKTLFFF